jgi:uncharacterized protein (TIGR03435 family)
MPRDVMFFAAIAAPLFAQSTSPSFDAASVKPTAHGRDVNGWSRSSSDIPSPGRFVAENESLGGLIREAYQLKDYQVIGPPWLDDGGDGFDIEAKAARDTTKPQVYEMLKTLLAERFKLVARPEKREMPVYLLVKGKGNQKLQPAASEGGRPSQRSIGGDVTFTSVTMADVAYQLARFTNRPVFDRTAVSGRFDLKLKYDPSPDGSGPSLADALQEQLGLRLESAKAPVDVLVVDHVERNPTGN